MTTPPIVAGLDVGGTKTNATLLDSKGVFLNNRMVETPSRVLEGPEAAIEAMAKALELAIGGAGVHWESVRVIGLDAPGPRMTLDEQTKARIVAFVQRFVAASQSDSNLSLLTTFYGPNVRFNGNSITREALRQRVENGIRAFPQRSWQFISGPTVTPALDSPGATVNYELSGVLSNGTSGMQVKTSVQLTVEKQGDQFKIVAIWPRVLERRAL